MNQPPILTIKMVPAGVDLVIQALSQLPYRQVAGLISEIQGQAEYQQQVKSISDAAIGEQKAAPKRRGGRPKGSKNKGHSAPSVEQVTTNEGAIQ